jgi:O-antigen ligase
MGSSLALLVCSIGIAGLFYLDRDKSIHTSKALWLPITWLAIVGSRPVTLWLGIRSGYLSVQQQMDGSPVDRLVYEILLALGIVVLMKRRHRIGNFFWGNWPILLYFAYCLISLFWSDYPDVAFKRWIKAIGDLVMALIVVTDANPAEAFKRMISRLGFVLLPASILLIKYFGNLGRGYTPDGYPMNTGVATNKNTLGVMTLGITIGALWSVRALLRDKDRPNRRRHLIAQVTLLIFGVANLDLAQSATSVACFIIAATLMLLTDIPLVKGRPVRVHGVVLALFLAGGFTYFIAGLAGVVHALGRETNLTGRTDIWNAVIAAVPNPIFGAGFETFWAGPRLEKVWSRLGQFMQVNEAHNGYLEVYLNLGWIGVGLIALLFLRSYAKIVSVFRDGPDAASLLIAYLFAAMFYGITEAGFRLLNPIWIFLLLAIVAAGGATRGVGALQPVSEAANEDGATIAAPVPFIHSGQFRPVAQGNSAQFPTRAQFAVPAEKRRLT